MRVVREKELQFLKREIRYLVDSKVLPAEKSNEIEALYVGRNQFPFTQTLLYVGAVLIGARILSFIASNWEEIDRVYNQKDSSTENHHSEIIKNFSLSSM